MTKYSLYSDKKLLASIAANDKGAFAELFNRYWRKAYVAAHAKTGSAETAEEIVQEIFVALWDKRSTLQIQNFASYLYISVKNKCLNHIASKAVQRKHWDEYENVLSRTADPADKNLGYDDLLNQIDSGMEGLPEKTKQIFRLNRLEGHSVPEIASALNLSAKAIEYHLTRSLKQLRTHLKGY